jgi:hypothetical protein
METRLIDFVQLALRRGKAPCVVRNLPIRFSVQGEVNGTWKALTPVQGNPARRRIGALLTPANGAFAFWAWWNWCGGSHNFRAFAQIADRPARGPASAQGATCEDSGSASTLTPSYGHVP